jgi:hypothetical protein
MPFIKNGEPEHHSNFAIDVRSRKSMDNGRQADCTQPKEVMADQNLPDAHPAFSNHFSAPIYEDAAGEFAPFGTDEGWDTLHSVAQNRDQLPDNATVRDVLALAGFPDAGGWDERPNGEEWYEDATMIAASAFSLLRLTGQIDDTGRHQALEALDILIDFFGDQPELQQQRVDLDSWTG